jgi:hypothetical protein
MIRRKLVFFCFLFFLGFSLTLVGAAPGKLTLDKYHTPDEVNGLLKSWAAKFPELTKLQTIGKSYGNKNIYVLRIAARGSAKPDFRPGVLISANIQGNHLVGSEAALLLIEKLLTGYGANKTITSLLQKRTVYAAPLLNPDAAQHFFKKPLYEYKTNHNPVDEDLDGLVDEDGPDDLNKDGFITRMRVKDPEGKWLTDPANPQLMRKADFKKGEKGVYKLYTEGLDNDDDGKYNEDPAGGVELNRNFPHDFEVNTRSAGMWPVSQKEAIALVDFLIAHNNIGLVLNFSSENTLLNLEQTGKARVGAAKVKVPKMFALILGFDPEKEYTLKEIVDALKGMGFAPPGVEITEELVASFLGLGPAMSIDNRDMPYFQAIQKEYKDALKEAKLNYPQKRAKGVIKGSFAAYCYYQLGTQVFSTDLWAVPEPKKKEKKDALNTEKLKAMSSEEFIALGEEKIDAFLKEQGAPANVKAAMLIKALEGGQLTPAKMAEMLEKMPKKAAGKEGEHPDAYILKWAQAALKGKGFIPWESYKHPTLRDVEIGGFVPYLKTNPPAKVFAKTISFHSDFYIKLMARLAELQIKETVVKRVDDSLYQVTLYISNGGWFPTATAQGRRARTAWPVRVRLKTTKDQVIFSGNRVERVPFLEGSGDTKKLEWTIKGKKGSKVSITASSPRTGTVTATLILK